MQVTARGRLDQAMTWWLRAYLLFAAVQGIALGITGFVDPPGIQIPLRMSDLNARFIGALYLAGGVGVLLAAFVRVRREARLFVLGFGAATALILVITLLHWGELMSEPKSLTQDPRPSWIIAYLLDPLLALLIVPLAGFLDLGPTTRHRLSPLFWIQAVVFGALGIGLILAPSLLAVVWPWSMTPVLLGQLYGCFFLSFAIGAALAAREESAVARRIFVLSSLALALCVLLASLLHLDRFRPNAASWVWFAAFGLIALAFAIASLLRPTRPGGTGQPATADS